MTDRLSLYNGALRECQDRKLGSLTENREPRRLLDDVWNDGVGVVRYVLQRKQWRFGRRTVEMSPDPSMEPSFGYRNVFGLPDDHCRTCGVWSDEYQSAPFLQYRFEAGYWYADLDPLYVTYVSDDTLYGGDLSSWPPNFVLYVETHMASLIAGRLTGSKADRNDLLKLAEMRLNESANTDAMEDPTQFPPDGLWVRSRRGGLSGQLDRGSRSRLIG
jgi:hypothetical protein